MRRWPNVINHQQQINCYASKITLENFQENMSIIYNYAKDVADEYCINNRIAGPYSGLLIHKVFNVEKKYGFDKKLLGQPIIIEISKEEPSRDDFIKYLIDNARLYLIKEYSSYSLRKGKVDFNNLILINYCRRSSRYVEDLCRKYNVECHSVSIFPGYNSEARLFDGYRHHHANVIKYDNNYYLVDLTYSQFFFNFKNNLDRLGVFGLDNCYPGVFMMLTEEGKQIANTIIKDGYIKLDEKVFKAYLDGFTMSFRNGLYYEDTNDFSYTTNYTVEDYIKFLRNEDDQIKHEGKENLGFQKRLLKNSSLKFKK